MKKFGRALFLMSSLAFLAGTASIEAQEKKAEPKKAETKKAADAKKGDEPTKKADSEKPGDGGKIEIYKSKGDGFRFRIVGADGKNICGAYKDYETKEDCFSILRQLSSNLLRLFRHKNGQKLLHESILRLANWLLKQN